MRKYDMLKIMKKLQKINPRLIAVLFLCIGALIGLVVYGMAHQRKDVEKKEVHYHAGFKVFVDGKEADFSDFKYMSVKPCTTEEYDDNDNDSHIHLHDGNGRVVHVHTEGFKWGDLFKSLHYTFEPTKQVTGFLNGKETSDILNKPIVAYDSIVIFVGDVSQNIDVQAMSVTKDDIVKAEKLSESCGKP